MTKTTENVPTMTVAEMRAAIEKAEAKDRLKADALKEKRDQLRAEAQKAHDEYMTFCQENGIPTKGKRKS